jgi:PHD/YefM family antitoxin component YafN of YafNO toxin-antitoxin module
MTTINANEVKTRGVSALDKAVKKDGEALIIVRGKPKYVVMDMDAYGDFREDQLEEAIRRTRADMKAGRYRVEGVEKHMKRVIRGAADIHRKL